MEENRFVLAIGNPFDGIQIVGPFDEVEEANAYAETLHTNLDWWVAAMQAPVSREGKE